MNDDFAEFSLLAGGLFPQVSGADERSAVLLGAIVRGVVIVVMLPDEELETFLRWLSGEKVSRRSMKLLKSHLLMDIMRANWLRMRAQELKSGKCQTIPPPILEPYDPGIVIDVRSGEAKVSRWVHSGLLPADNWRDLEGEALRYVWHVRLCELQHKTVDISGLYRCPRWITRWAVWSSWPEPQERDSPPEEENYG